MQVRSGTSSPGDVSSPSRHLSAQQQTKSSRAARRAMGRRHSVASTASSASQPSPLKRAVRLVDRTGEQSSGAKEESRGRSEQQQQQHPQLQLQSQQSRLQMRVPHLDLSGTATGPGGSGRRPNISPSRRKGSDDSCFSRRTDSPTRSGLGIAEGRRQSGGSI